MSKQIKKQVRLVILDRNTITDDLPEGERYLAIMPAHRVAKYKAGLPVNHVVTKEYWK